MTGLVAIQTWKSNNSSVRQGADYLTIEGIGSSYKAISEGPVVTAVGSFLENVARSANEQTVSSPKWPDIARYIVVVEPPLGQQLIPAKIRMLNSAKARKIVAWCFIETRIAPQFVADKIDKEVFRAFQKITSKGSYVGFGRQKRVIFTPQTQKENPPKIPSQIDQIEFRPSDELVAIIERGILKFVEEMKSGKESEFLKTSEPLNEFLQDEAKSNRRSLIASQLFKLISTIAFRQGDGMETKLPITSDGEFNSQYWNAFLDVFPIWPKDLPQFENVLKSDLIRHLQNGGEFKGSWGSLEVLNNELVTVYAEDSVARLEVGWKKSPRLSR